MKDPWTIAIDPSLPGKGDWTGCQKFADALFAALKANGTPCREIAYHWRGLSIAGQPSDVSGIERDHAIVLYRMPTGYFFVMDATSRGVRLISSDDAATIEATAAFFEGVEKETSNVRLLDEANWQAS